MNKRLVITFALICFAMLSSVTHAGWLDGKKDNKESLVLMPLRVIGGDASLRGTMETALVEGLQQKYEAR